MALYKAGGFTPDPWRRVDAIEDLPPEGEVIITLDMWRRMAALPKRHSNVAFGLQLDPGHPVEAVAADLPLFALVAIGFPKFTDGRGYSMARQIRDDHKFRGELRATGDVLFDQLQFMARCGFDTFEINDPATLRLLRAGRHPVMTHFYQPGEGDAPQPAGPRPWRRRPGS